ncbi:MAG: NAD-dependent epimerase/dehydratase family protein [Bacteroidetes bacterium]|nr:MAG: NAD-dependent epimerase/dehydratase family protein [Bacteroidota bacterium]
MKKVFVSGATGYIGEVLSTKIAELGLQVQVLVRNPAKSHRLQHPNISVVGGTLADQDQLLSAMEGCSEAYHVAALAGVWDPDPAAFRKVNVEGTLQVLHAAHRQGVRRVVLTSTAGVMGPTPDGQPVRENTNPVPILTTAYEASKLEAEEKARAFGQETGLEVVIVNPSRVYGPGQWSESNAVTKMIRGYASGTWRLIPGDGSSIGNYVFVEDVVHGHLLAMEKGRPGKRYILGGENSSFNAFFDRMAKLTGRRHRMIRLPLPVMMGFAQTQQLLADTFGRRPLITPPFVRKYMRDWPLSSQQAETELGYSPVSLEEGMQRTLEWLQRRP